MGGPPHITRLGAENRARLRRRDLSAGSYLGRTSDGDAAVPSCFYKIVQRTQCGNTVRYIAKRARASDRSLCPARNFRNLRWKWYWSPPRRPILSTGYVEDLASVSPEHLAVSTGGNGSTHPITSESRRDASRGAQFSGHANARLAAALVPGVRGYTWPDGDLSPALSRAVNGISEIF